jgi:uncharacterized protein YbaP (TraB family)
MPESAAPLEDIDPQPTSLPGQRRWQGPRRLALLIAGLVALAGWLSSCSAAPPSPPAPAAPTICPPLPEIEAPVDASIPARAPFYRVESDQGGVLFLFGTIHLGPAEGWTLSAPVQSAIEASRAFVFEIDLGEATEAHVSTIVANNALLEPGTRLADRVSPETLALLETHTETLTQLGFPERIRSMMKPWFLALGLLESQVGLTSYRLDEAADRLIFEAKGARRLIALETVEEQIALFDDLPPELQDLMLRDALSRHDEADRSIEALVHAWHAGDDLTLACLAREGVDALPGLEIFYERVLDERNRSWLTALRPLLDAPSSDSSPAFVAVGALHLVGPTSLPVLLEEAGFGVVAVRQGEAS